MRKTVLSILTLPLVVTLPACFQLGAEAHVGYAQLALDGDFGYAEGTGQANIQQDVQSGLGLGDDQGSPYARANLDFGVPNLSLSLLNFEDQGEGTLDATFGTLQPGVPVRTQFEMFNAKAGYGFEIGLGPVSVTPGVALTYFNIKLDAQDAFGVRSEDVVLDWPLPLGFVRAEAELGPVGAFVEVGYLPADIDDVEGEILDLEAQLRIQPAPLVDLFVGYRSLGVQFEGNIDGDSFDTDITLSGFTVGGGVRF